MLAYLRSLNLPLGVVSNSSFTTRTLCLQLASLDLLSPFQFVMSSADYVIRKPHRAIFLTAAAKLGIEPADIWFIGDTFEADIVGASNAGMTPVWYNRKRSTAPLPVAHLDIHAWAELKGLMNLLP